MAVRHENMEPIGGLFARLIADGKAFARAEIELYKQHALSRVTGLKSAAILLVVAVLIVQAALTTLLVGIGLLIGRLIPALGQAGGVIIAAVLGLLIAGLLAWIGIGRVTASLKGPAPVGGTRP